MIKRGKYLISFERKQIVYVNIVLVPWERHVESLAPIMQLPGLISTLLISEEFYS